MHDVLSRIACAAILLLSAGVAEAKNISPVEPKGPPVALQEIDRALREQRPMQAKILLERAQMAGQDGPGLQLLLAEYWLSTGAAEQAKAAFDRLSSEPEQRARALQGSGIAALRLGDAEQARAALEAAVAADPSLPRAWTALGVAADLMRDFARSEKAYAQALALAPGAFEILSNRGYSRLVQKRMDESVADLTAAARLAPRDETVRTNLTLALAMSGRYEEAASGANRRQSARQRNNVGIAAAMRGDYAAAEGFFSEALAQSDVFYRTAWYNLLQVRQHRPGPDVHSGVSVR